MADFGPCFADSPGGTSFLSALPGASPTYYAHTKGAWTYDGSITTRAEGLVIHPSWWQNYASVRTILLDIGVGAGGDVLINNLMFCPSSYGTGGGRIHQVPVYFPIQVPDQQLGIRAQSNYASHGIGYVQICRRRSGLPVFGKVDTYGADTANSRGTPITAPNLDSTWGSWTTVSASCETCRAMVVAVGHGNQAWNSLVDQMYWIEIGFGAAGQEQTIISATEAGGSSSVSAIPSSPFLGPYYVDVPAGSRLCARVAKQGANSNQRTVDVVLYGIR